MKALALTIVLGLAGQSRGTPIPSEEVQAPGRHFYPVTDNSTDRDQANRLKPSHSPRVLYTEIPHNSLAIATTYKTVHPTVILDDSSLVKYHCDNDKKTLTVRFATQAAFNQAIIWPNDGLVLITNDPSCNSANERGIYQVENGTPQTETFEWHAEIKSTTWKAVASTMTIEYLEGRVVAEDTEQTFVAQERRGVSDDDEVNSQLSARAIQTCRNTNPPGYICGGRGQVSRPTRLKAPFQVSSAADCRDVCLANKSCVSFAHGNHECALFGKSIVAQGFQSSKTSGNSFWNRHCFTCTAVKPTASVVKSSSSNKSTSTLNRSVISTTKTSMTRKVTTTSTVSSKASSSFKGKSATTRSTTAVTTATTTTSSAKQQTTSTFVPTTTSSTVSTSSSKVVFPSTIPTSLDPSAKAIYNSILAGVRTNSDGQISASFSGAFTSRSASPVTADAADTSAQASLQTQLVAAGLPLATQVFTSAAAALSSAGLAPTPSAVNTFDDDSSGQLEKKVLAPSNITQQMALPEAHLVKRYSFYDFISDVDDYGCNSFVTGLCETCGDVCDGIEGGIDTYNAIQCLAAHCLDPKKGDQIMTSTYDTPWNFYAGLHNGVVSRAAKSQLSCENCGIQISNFQLSGGFTVDLTTMGVLAFTLTAKQSSVATFQMSIDSGGADAGSWSYVVDSFPLGPITATNVFSLSPQVLYTMGASWSTSSATTYSTGATVTLTDATLSGDIFGRTVSDNSNWQPVIDIVTPDYETADTVTLNPYMQTSIQMAIQVLGQTVQSSLSLNTQVTIGQSGGFVVLENAGVSYCPAGQFQTSNYDSINNYIDFSGVNQVNLYSTSSMATPVCSARPPNPATPSQISALAAISNGPAFCTSLISYTPSVVTLTSTVTITIATSTVTEVGGTGTTTITPGGTSATTTVFVSVSSYVANQKRAAPTTEVVPTATATSLSTPPTANGQKLLPRRFVPTPAILRSWLPQQVTSACSVIATGTVNTTSTVTTTTSFGITTDIVQATVTAATPTSYTTVTNYVPAASPTNILSADFKGWNNSGSYIIGFTPDHTIMSANVLWNYDPTYFYNPAYRNSYVTYNLSGLEIGWTYALSFEHMGKNMTTNSCNLTYYLDDYLMGTQSPIIDNGWSGTNAALATMTSDGPYRVQPTATTGTLTLSVACASATAHIGWMAPQFYGPTD
ncbi:hypothetical protein K461DRAFT_316496 [Myriangium duriaei CBS 260.36]|uniref:Apple domain-containing protein n=1 Tax=Myriangium duriaei CBS 260.36 TaxID=1168546 RepID=A0A9P4IWE5_9PEZI|nr:hypothetical protein K461DRAFT_316496 [Myriangium duriaei CBS 260.36]